MAAPPISASPCDSILSATTDLTLATIAAAGTVLIEHATFSSLSDHLTHLLPLLPSLPPTTLHLLTPHLSTAHSLFLSSSRRNRLHLLLNSRRILHRLHSATHHIAHVLSLTPDADHLSATMLADFPGKEPESTLDKLKSAIRDHSADRAYANNLLTLISTALAIPNDRPALQRELEELRAEIADTELRKDLAEVVQIEQIVTLLGRADSTHSFKERELIVNYHFRRSTLGNVPLESFYCPITKEVMEDPVETVSGHTFERKAIESLVAEGNVDGPGTMVGLEVGGFRPNVSLRRSIEEWKELNVMVEISCLKSKLGESEEQEVLDSLGRLLEICEESEMHKEWVVLENYAPVLIGLLAIKNSEMRRGSLSILFILASDNDDTKERISEVDNAIRYIVHSLGRSRDESQLAVALLLELSKCDMVCELIGKAQGCILLLVTLSNSDDTQAANDAKHLLENLSGCEETVVQMAKANYFTPLLWHLRSVCEENVVQMAKANYFTPLLWHLRSGSDDVKKMMVTTLAEMELTDHSKAAIFKGGALRQLIDLVSQVDNEMTTMSIKALQNLSSLQQNSVDMIMEGAIHPLLHLLYHLNTSTSSDLGERVADTIMGMAILVAPLQTSENMTFLNYEDVLRLFSLIHFAGPNIQRSILRTFYAFCRFPSGKEMRAMLKECSAISILVHRCEHSDPIVRENAVKLLSCLMEDGMHNMPAEPVSQGCLKALLSTIQASCDAEEKAAALGIISNLPAGHTQIPQWLIDKALPVIVRILSDTVGNKLAKNQLTENAVGALCQFTVSTNPEGQKRAAEAGVIPLLIQLLQTGTTLTKRHAAVSLAQLSDHSPELSRPVVKRGCFPCIKPRGCRVHMGVCSVEISFCLLEANAVGPLVRLLDEPSARVCEAALRALSTIIEGERLDSGSKVLDGSNGIAPMIRLLSSNSTKVQVKSLSILERIFRLEEYKRKYGALVQMPLVDLTRRGTGTIRSSAARILGHLKVLPELSSYY